MLGLLLMLASDVPRINPPPPEPLMRRWTASEVKRDPRPNQSWFSDKDYPASSRRAGEQGPVTIGLSIDTAGQITECWIIESSGFPVLDARTCELALARGKFNIARDKNGTAQSYRYSLRANWQL